MRPGKKTEEAQKILIKSPHWGLGFRGLGFRVFQNPKTPKPPTPPPKKKKKNPKSLESCRFGVRAQPNPPKPFKAPRSTQASATTPHLTYPYNPKPYNPYNPKTLNPKALNPKALNPINPTYAYSTPFQGKPYEEPYKRNPKPGPLLDTVLHFGL